MVRLSGDLDLASAPRLSAQFEKELRGEGDVVVDARDLSFVDVSGCRALLEVAERLPDRRRLVLAHAPAQLVRILGLCGWLDFPRLVVRPEVIGGTA